MISEEIKTKNGLMEKFYELVNEKLQGIETYEAAKLRLFSLLSTSGISTHTTVESAHILVSFDGNEHDFIQLYRGDRDSYYLCISPPPEQGSISKQITVVRNLISCL